MARRMILATLAACLVVLLSVSTKAQDDKNDKDQPQVSGMTQGNTGCAIMEKHTPVKGKLLLVGVVYARTEYKVLQTFHATLPRDKFTGPGEVKELNDLAVRNKIKLVVIPTNYSDDELAQARGLCGQPANAPASGLPPGPPSP
jgi:hypothetical protein